MDLQALQAFIKVVQTGSFTRAADALGTHKAHLSRVVSQLERELGARLLERSTRSLSLTEVGREFHERGVAILAAVDDARQAVEQSQAEPRGTLRLTCGVEFGMLAVSGWIHDYLARYPQMKVEAEITGRIVDVVHEGFDLAIRVGHLPDSTLTARRLGSLSYALYAAPAYLQQRGVPRTPEELSRHELLVFAPGSATTAWVLSRDGDTSRVPLIQARFRASSSFAVRDAAAAGLGVALLPQLIGEPLVAAGLLRGVLPGWVPPEVPVSAVFASARFLAPKVRAFVELALTSFKGVTPP
ncbi:LysR family transcriptional regulator [Ideonella paludis]|uniref:LysR family transcriptional regulator n=1 Tax=Ideonella paludis TaxID=1233411 RepID=A0ABS5DZ15_9BURK|nr:LysR family transcriptional regulator [Ideonella paludis]MBQ0936390.1 LysR family transcriptional regulator [Ideonella paludis]